MRIGILGGTFNPVHNAHLQMAALARDTLSLDLVLLMVAADPPHKPVSGAVAGGDRLAMTRLAAEPLACIEASDLELTRTGKSYTVDTLGELHARYPGSALYFLIGSDMLQNFPTWRRPHDIARLAALAVTPRIGEDAADAENAEAVRAEFGAEIVFLPAGADPISSTEVRERVSRGLPVDALVPLSVELYLIERGLYFTEAVRQMQQKLRQRLSAPRFLHSCGTVAEASRLAAKWGADPAKAQLAALLHDCAKCMPQDRLQALAGDDTLVAPILHAHAGAVVAREEYGVTDEAVLRAIYLHATGDADMSVLDMVTYIADIVEPYRNYPGVAEIRAMVPLGPERTMLFALTRTREHVLRNDHPFHPATLRALDYFSHKIKTNY